MADSLKADDIKKVGNGRRKIKIKKGSNEDPPKAGEDHVIKINGKEKTWCGHCSLWADHSTNDHCAMIQAAIDKEKDKNDDESAVSEAGMVVIDDN
jgi:hypothetical protein